MFNPDDIDEDYIVWCVAYDEYYGYDNETDAQTRAFLRTLLADAWDEGFNASENNATDTPNPYRTVKGN